MHLFTLFSVLISLAALFSYTNARFFRMPSGINLMFMGTLVSIGLIIAGRFSDSFTNSVKASLSVIDFSEFLLGIVLSFLLFAGSLHLKLEELISSAKSIISFAIIGTLISTFLIGLSVYYLLPFFSINVDFVVCLLFGALISPTDPIAVIGLLKSANISKSIEVKINGESLFNDGIGVVLFATILDVNINGIENTTFFSVLTLFSQEAIGGLVAGLVIGFVGFRMLKSINHFQTEILITLAMVMGGYSLCHFLHVSGPLAMVIAGLYTGNKSRMEAMSEITRDYLEKFWEVTDEILNAVLFILIGLEIVVINMELNNIFIGLIVVILLLITRYISLWIPAHLFRFNKTLENNSLQIMTWGGLRGGISIALALSLPNEWYKDVFVTFTFVIVSFSILVQGFSMGKIIKLLHVKTKGSKSSQFL